MNTTDNRRDARSRAARRLRRLTIGTAVIGVVATGGLSVLAAATDDGSNATATAAVATTASGATATTPSATGATPSATGATASTAPIVTAASGTGQASTGGS